MIDLHVHTYYSDGTLSPEKVVERAKQRGVTTLSITDHDGLEGILEAQQAGKQHGVRIIPGIELSAAIEEGDIFSRQAESGQEIYMHILGYGIDKENKSLKEVISEIQENRVRRNEKMLLVLKELGYSLSVEDLQTDPHSRYIGKPNMARALVKKGYISYAKEAFEKGKFLSHPEVKKIHRVKIEATEAIDLIKDAGGIAVLAHPMKITYKNKNEEGSFYDKLWPLLLELKKCGLGGLECYYSSHLISETERLLEMAEKAQLLISAGTDFHGPDMSKVIDIGKFPISPSKSNLQHSIHL